ncbi:unnamed protein product [Clonostachys chloroleuca]|uniref:Uncharacterized protein n=1 Tax=Clonostachys chloroleuca TaxID=1926264 RepID=A0AA35QCS2_9HYPO|nr:unnamed protein product [Clonostachys chloroleuca]
MATHIDDAVSGLTALFQHVSRTFGFSRAHNFAVWLVLCGPFTAFILTHLRYLDINGYFCGKPRVAMPGECYYFSRGVGRIGLFLHLATIFPAGLLAVLQFTPAVRKRSISLHRYIGYVVLVLVVLSSLGVLVISRHHFGGGLVPQTVSGAATSMFLVSLAFALYYVKRLRIDLHRAWMMRAWAVATHVITMRLIAYLMVVFTHSPLNHYYDYRPCAVIDYIFKHDPDLVISMCPDCADFYSRVSPDQRVLISADIMSGRPDKVAAGLNVTFGAAAWLGLLFHCIVIETYLQLTPGETERLRRLSYKRQLEAGMVKEGDCTCAAIFSVEKGGLMGRGEGWGCRQHDKVLGVSDDE